MYRGEMIANDQRDERKAKEDLNARGMNALQAKPYNSLEEKKWKG